MNVFSPYNIELAKVVIRAIAAKVQLKQGVKFLMFQDTPGEGMQAYMFKRFYWWEDEATQTMANAFGMKLIHKSWRKLAEDAKAISDDEARKISADWDINKAEDLTEKSFLSAVSYILPLKRNAKKKAM